jgi:ABC-2 type transport system permease protein
MSSSSSTTSSTSSAASPSPEDATEDTSEDTARSAGVASEAASAVRAGAPGTIGLDQRGGIPAHLRAVKVVCHRELLRVKSDRIRLVSSLAQPFLFLFVMGTGLSRLTEGTTGVNFRTFLYPGVLAMSVLFTAMFSAMSIVWDREFGFLREMLVAPVPRSAIVVGKALGGAAVATGQGVMVLTLAGFAGVPYDPVMLALLVVELFVLSFTICSFGLMIAARIRQIQAFMGIMNLMVMPLFFLSGGLYPLSNLPDWLQVVARFNPITYAVSAMRHTVFVQLDVGPQVRDNLDPGLTWFGWQVPSALAVVAVAAIGLALLRIAAAELQADD